MEPHRDDPGRPEWVGPYRLAAPIGRGGMGVVWRAWDERLKRPVAVKHIRADTQLTELRQRLLREAQAAARLNHSAIVHIYDLVESPEGDWIVMELVEGQTLRSFIQEKGALPLEQAIRIGLDISEGLAEAHSHGILHRDLKAANVMVTPAGRAKILDFGLAKQLSRGDGDDQEASLSGTGLVVGTSYAMSPEQVLGQPLDARSDLFSLGSLLYEMLTGEPPFRSNTPAASQAAILSLRPPPLGDVRPGLPQGLSDLIGLLLEKDCRFRPQNAIEVARSLAGLAGVSVPDEDSQASTVEERALVRLPERLPISANAGVKGGLVRRIWDVTSGAIVLAAHGTPGRPDLSGTGRTKSFAWLWGLGLSLLVLALTLSVWLRPRFIVNPLPKPEMYAVQVQVLDPQGRPADQARLRAPVGMTPRQLPDGWWEVRIPGAKVPADGLVSLWAEHEEWEGSRTDLHLGEAPSLRAEIRLKRPESWLRGRVTDDADQSLPGVRISLQDGTAAETITDAKGRFALELPVRRETRVRLRAERDGWEPGDEFCYAGRDSCWFVLEKQ
ncbi:MAG TPA: protein kinase [Thermoanaerobaculia bacterium]|nr:protein kinase [Thermoanaerobaculia bacterium]